MPLTITVECPVRESPRVAQVRGLFDLPAAKTSRLEWTVDLPLTERPWQIGLVTGPSGCGKSTLARRLWPEALARTPGWPDDASLLDAFPETLSIKDVTGLLSSVGFSSPPAWLRPFRVLSTGQQFRVTLARLLAEALAAPPPRPIVVLDEFTSVVDRTVARIGSAALAKTVRAHGLQFVAVTCHDDVIDWLQPDWVFTPPASPAVGRCGEAASRGARPTAPQEDSGRFTWRSLQRRPALALEVVRCQASAWPLVAAHHYLSGSCVRSAVCFLAACEGRPVAFSAWLPFLGKGPPTRREHRTVVLPDYQGAGIGMALTSLLAAMWKGLGYRATSTTTHPAFIAARMRSREWRLVRPPSLSGHPAAARCRAAASRGARAAAPQRGFDRRLKHATTRLTAGFEYVGPALPRLEALSLLSS
jgi:GNAT superfamily N-acetyltransferase